MSDLIARLQSYISDGDGYNSEYADTLAEAVAALQERTAADAVPIGWIFNRPGLRGGVAFEYGPERPDERLSWLPLFAAPAIQPSAVDARAIAGNVIDAIEEETGLTIWPKDSDALSELLDVCEDAIQPEPVSKGDDAGFRFQRGEIDLLRQWFNAVHDTNRGFLGDPDFALAKAIYRMCGARWPNEQKTAPPASNERRPVTMDDAVAAGNGTLHGAIDYWQERAVRAEAALAGTEPVSQPADAPYALEGLMDSLLDAYARGGPALKTAKDNLRAYVATLTRTNCNECSNEGCIYCAEFAGEGK